MSFLFSSGMLQASHSSQAYMIQWQLIHPWCRYTTSIPTLFMQVQRTGWLPSWIRQWGVCEPSINMTSPLKITLVPCPLGSRSSKTNITLRAGAPGLEVLSVTSESTESESAGCTVLCSEALGSGIIWNSIMHRGFSCMSNSLDRLIMTYLSNDNNIKH